MDPRRIRKTGTAGNAQANFESSKRLDTFQNDSYDNQLARISTLLKTSQPIPDSTWTGVNFDFDEFDDYGIHTGTNDYDFVFEDSNAGVWSVTMYSLWESDTTGSRNMRVMINETEMVPQSYMRLLASSSTAAGSCIIQSNFLITVQDGDTLSVEVAQYSGGDLDLEGASFQAFRIGV